MKQHKHRRHHAKEQQQHTLFILCVPVPLRMFALHYCVIFSRFTLSIRLLKKFAYHGKRHRKISPAALFGILFGKNLTSSSLTL